MTHNLTGKEKENLIIDIIITINNDDKQNENWNISRILKDLLNKKLKQANSIKAKNNF